MLFCEGVNHKRSTAVFLICIYGHFCLFRFPLAPAQQQLFFLNRLIKIVFVLYGQKEQHYHHLCNSLSPSRQKHLVSVGQGGKIYKLLYIHVFECLWVFMFVCVCVCRCEWVCAVSRCVFGWRVRERHGKLQVCVSIWIQEQHPADQLPRWRLCPVVFGLYVLPLAENKN